MKSQTAAWRKANKEQFAEVKAKYKQEHPEKDRAYRAAYRKAHPQKMAATTARHRASKFQATPAWGTKSLIDSIYAQAHLESVTTGIPHHVDHIVPLQSKLVCGLHVEFNLQVLTASKNCSKNNKYWPGMP